MALQAGGDAQARTAPGKLHVVCRKTKLCKFDVFGTCSKGDACGWAHGNGELLPTPDLSRTKACSAFQAQGRCDLAACRFAHTRTEIRRVRLRQARYDGSFSPPPSAPVGVAARCSGRSAKLGGAAVRFDRQLSASTAASERELGTSPPGPRDRFLKTKICMFFQRGSCSKQESCSYAHAVEELTALPDLLRTKMCKAAAAGQRCSAEGSCRFAHSEKELRQACGPGPAVPQGLVTGAEAVGPGSQGLAGLDGVRAYADAAQEPAVLLAAACGAFL